MIRAPTLSSDQLAVVSGCLLTPQSFISHVEGKQESEFTQHAHKLTTTAYGGTWATEGLPQHELADDEINPRTASRLISDLMLGDSTPAMNLASFVSTGLEPEARDLMLSALTVNMIDSEEYPGMAEIEQRCVRMIANLYNGPEGTLGVSTIGSSEAIILSVLAAKRRWLIKRRAEGKSTDKPNLVMTSAVQVCWEKAARYLEVEERYVYCTEDRTVIDPREAVDVCDENTIMVCGVLGLTYTGEYEDIQTLNDLLEEKCKKDGLDIHIHVDAASGGFVAPFTAPALVWDFRLPRVCAINVSGHKFGLTVAGCGWILLRHKSFLPEELAFSIDYLGAAQISFTLNFSKSGIQVLNQYYNLVRLGRAGYTAIMSNLTVLSDYLAQQIVAIDSGKRFQLMSATGGKGLPLVAWRLKPGSSTFTEDAMAHGLRERGWTVPSYSMPPKASEIKMLRVVIRSDFSRDRAESFLRDLKAVLDRLDKTPKAVLDHQAKQREDDKTAQHQDKPEHRHSLADVIRHALQAEGKTAPIC